MMWMYSAMLAVGLVLSAPWWLLRMVMTERYREGLAERLGRVPTSLLAVVTGKRVIWVHAVSVGEVLAATRLVAELEEALVSEMGDGWVVVVSTTTRTGQALARERFGVGRVFYFPLDFAWAVRAYLRVLKPAAVVLMESEVWPRLLWECRRGGVPVVVANARVSDRSLARGLRVKKIWGRVLLGVGLWLAQSEEDGRRLVAMGVSEGSVKVVGNLKYDVRAARESRVAELIKAEAGGRPIVVAGSTVDRTSKDGLSEDEIVIQAWEGRLRRDLGVMLVLAPRHPERFGSVESVAMEFSYVRASDGGSAKEGTPPFANCAKDGRPDSVARPEILLLDTIGDLAAVYGVADVAFVGGSLVKRGGHNPLEPAQFGVPVVMGPSYENFRDILGKMVAVEGIEIVGGSQAGLSAASAKSADFGRDDNSVVRELEAVLVRLLTDRVGARAMGERGRRVFEAEQGATRRAVEAIVAVITGGSK